MTHSTPTAADLAALRWACLVDPFADLPRLVLADALEEVGREEETREAEFIRVQCELEGIPGYPRFWDGDRYPQAYDLHNRMLWLLSEWDYRRGWRHLAGREAVKMVPDGMAWHDMFTFRRGFLDELRAPLDVILQNLDGFRLHPITQVVATDKRPLHYEGLKEWTWWFEEEEESEPEASLPKIIWNRLRPTKNKNRRGYTRGDANYYTKSEALEDLSRAIVSLGREHAGLPQLRWPG